MNQEGMEDWDYEIDDGGISLQAGEECYQDGGRGYAGARAKEKTFAEETADSVRESVFS